jgi:hypothetical protein
VKPWPRSPSRSNRAAVLATGPGADLGFERAARDSNPNRQIRRLVVNVMAGQVGVLSLVSYQTSGMVLTRRLPRGLP